MSTPPICANWQGKDAESLLWLASYPRSGNTFTRILLANYFSASDEAYDINALSAFCPADTSTALWQAHAPAGIKETWQARPLLFAHYRKTKDPGLFPGLKTHSGNILLYGLEGFDIRPTDRVIYIVRHPLDVAVSFADYNGKDLDSAIDELCTPGAYARDERAGALEVRGSWVEHAESWLLAPPCELLLIRYEDLCATPDKALRAMLAFLQAPIVEERIARAVAASRFDALREQEVQKTFKEAPAGSTSGSFFRRGESLQWLRALSPDQAYRLAENCSRVMRRVGYAHPAEVFFDGRNAPPPEV